ncbi:hypothetical protein HK102_009537 [Quaeritorhiza haematococci]|nr:hypothetical protein HK102_009537 [Quaeritorhiza haematococci]
MAFQRLFTPIPFVRGGFPLRSVPQTLTALAPYSTAAAPKKPAPSPVAIAKAQLRSLAKPSVEPPKRPATAFSLFMKENRSKFENAPELEGLTGIQRNQKIVTLTAAHWANMTQAEKEEYHKKNVEPLKKKYEQEYQKYLDNRTAQDVHLENLRYQLQKKINPKKPMPKPKADPFAPKRPATPYFMFAAEVRNTSAENQKKILDGKTLDGMPLKDQAKIVAAAWRAAPDSLKEKYEDVYKQAAKQFKEDLTTYEKANELDQFKQAVSKKLRSIANPPKPKPVKVVVVKKPIVIKKKPVVAKKPVAPKKKPVTTAAAKGKTAVKKPAVALKTKKVAIGKVAPKKKVVKKSFK